MAIELRYRVVDVFSDRPLAGNALCVVLDPCPEPVMAAIAREVNLSETIGVRQDLNVRNSGAAGRYPSCRILPSR